MPSSCAVTSRSRGHVPHSQFIQMSLCSSLAPNREWFLPSNYLPHAENQPMPMTNKSDHRISARIVTWSITGKACDVSHARLWEMAQQLARHSAFSSRFTNAYKPLLLTSKKPKKGFFTGYLPMLKINSQ